MDDSTLDSLRVALDASPDNLELRMVLVRAYLDRDRCDAACELLDAIRPSQLVSGEQRRTAASAWLAHGEPENGLVALADDDEPQSLLIKARLLLELDRHREGLDAYQAAVAASPALEDPSLRDRLASTVRVYQHPGSSDGRRLKVISNDDTDDTELDRLLMPATETITFADVGGLDAIKNQIRKKIILPFEKPSLFQRFRKRVGGGILLYGPPGCGKTLLARATAGECEAEFLNVAISDVLDMYIGESERKLHALFDRARSSLPSVLFFDELEALGGKRQYTREGTSSKLVSMFLSEMDGFTQANQGVLILAATNVPWAIDAAFRRPGRFDRMLFVPPPDRVARAAILDILLRDRPVAETINTASLARQTGKYSGADLENLVETATDAAIEASIDAGREVPLNGKHLQEALGEVRSTTLEWLTTARNYARYANEAGQYDEVMRFLDKHGKG